MSALIEHLIQDFARLPGIGERTAQRLVYHLLREGRALMAEFVRDFEKALLNIQFCSVCQDFTEQDPCPICRDSRRQDEMICILEDPSARFAIERSKAYRGRYHILHGLLSPLDGVGPDQLRISTLLARLEKQKVEELIIALNTSVNGDATALYLSRLLAPLGFRISRLSIGVPVGADLEYLDHMTLARAIEHRVLV